MYEGSFCNSDRSTPGIPKDLKMRLAGASLTRKFRFQTVAMIDHLLEGCLVQARRAGGNDHPVQAIVDNILLDLLLSRLGAGVDDVLGDDDAVFVLHGLGDAVAVHGLGDIEAAVADVDTDAGILGWF